MIGINMPTILYKLSSNVVLNEKMWFDDLIALGSSFQYLAPLNCSVFWPNVFNFLCKK